MYRHDRPVLYLPNAFISARKLRKARHDVDRQCLFARRVTGNHVVTLTTAGIALVILPVADDAAAPHLGTFAGGPAHHGASFLTSARRAGSSIALMNSVTLAFVA